MTIEEALTRQRWETARRLALAALGRAGGDIFARREQLHEALRRLGDLPQARAVLEESAPETDAQRLTVPLLLGEDFHLLLDEGCYRDSAQARAGLSLDEYRDEMRSRRDAEWDRAKALAKTPKERQRVADTLARCGLETESAAPLHKDTFPAAAAPAGSIAGRLRFPGGGLAAGTRVTLGLAMETQQQDPATYLGDRMNALPQIGPQDALTTRTDAEGCFDFPAVPAGRQEFLAVTLDAAHYDIPTRFLAQGMDVAPGKELWLDLTVEEWQSAPARVALSPFAAQMERGGVHYALLHQETWKNPFYYDFPRQAVTLPAPPDAPAERLLLLSSDDPTKPLPFQCTEAGLLTLIGLPSLTDKTVALYAAENSPAEASPLPAGLHLTPDPDGQTAILSTGRAEFRLPWGEGADSLPPLLSVRGEDDLWRGAGRFTLPEGTQIVHRQTTLVEQGPLQVTLEVAYALSDGKHYTVRWTAHQGEAYLLAREISPPLDDAAWEFSLREWGESPLTPNAGGTRGEGAMNRAPTIPAPQDWGGGAFSGGRGFLHWTPEGKTVHWTTPAAQDKELARLQESVPWWLPPCGFGYAFTADGLASQDYIALFTLRRGEWRDEAFAAIAQGPGEGESRELDWPFPEMVGSTLSMLTAHSDASGDAFFRFAFFDGQRQWGILVSTLARNDGQWKELSAVQHKNSSPRLQDFKDWRLDEPDSITRPSVAARRQDLRALRRKKDAPRFAPVWQKIVAGNVPGPAEGLRFAVEGDPRLAWRKKKELVGVAHVRAKLTLLGRDFSDMYSPVGGRPITAWAEDYDLVAASGVFTPDEERLVRAFLLLMGHLYGETDLMNWRYGSRNANFEADRVDVVGTVGLTFQGNPDADAMARHAAESMERALNVYCTPGSGKWYENPACYYLQSSKCRLNLAFHLWSHGISDPTAIPRLRDFLNWGILLLTPPAPTSYAALANGVDDYDAAPKTRRIPPIGDHAGLGRWLPEHYALAAKMYRDRAPEFADRLLWAWQSANPDAGGPAQAAPEQPGEMPNSTDGSDFGSLPLLFAALDEEDVRPAPDCALASRRLEGFGAVLRGGFGTAQEFYLLWKQGPGGYRFHRTEGSFVLFADGKPLVYDGGEGGETWRHSTLSFGNVYTPLAPGHVERFHALPEAEFVQGVHPVALKPGEPVYLSDNCHHSLVPVAHARYAEPNPADVRSALWVKDEYVILHDDLNLPPETVFHWHLQVVADSEEGDAERGWRFRGRFGVDLQVMLPGQKFASAQVTTTTHLERNLPPEQAFTMRHLCVTGGPGASGYFALLRPLPTGKPPVSATLLETEGRAVGLSVTGDGLHDRLFFGRAPVQWEAGGLRFQGRYGAVLERPTETHLLLLGPGVLEWGGVRLESDGPALSRTIT